MERIDLTPEQEKLFIESMRAYGDTRFKILTVFSAGASLLFGAIFTLDTNKGVTLPPPMEPKTLISAAAMLLTFVFWLMEVRTTLAYVEMRKCVAHLWPRNSSKVKWLKWINLINQTNAVALLYVAHYIVWFWLADKWNMSGVWLGVLGSLFVVILGITAALYWPLWKHALRGDD